MCPHVGEAEVGAAEPVHGVPGPLQTVEVPSPAYQVILLGVARAVMVNPPAEAVAVCVCHQPSKRPAPLHRRPTAPRCRPDAEHAAPR